MIQLLSPGGSSFTFRAYCKCELIAVQGADPGTAREVQAITLNSTLSLRLVEPDHKLFFLWV